MRNRGIKAYFTQLNAAEVDPAAFAAYKESIDKVIPTITRKLRESEQLAADFLVSPTVASRSRVPASRKKK